MEIEKLIVHCSATPPSLDIGANDIRQWHVNGNGWSDIGYHYVIRRSGAVERGRPEDRQGAHAKGYNDCSLGICLIGGTDSEGKSEPNYTRAQYRSLESLLISLSLKYPGAEILGHKDLDGVSKDCPCFNVREFWR